MAKQYLLSLIGTFAMHGTIAALAMQPSAPISIPQQQVMQIAMITEAAPKQEVIKPITKTVPKPYGMVKVKHLQKLETASGAQPAKAKLSQAAVTQPIAAAYLNNPAPAYPASARRRNIEGKVLLKVDVTKNGKASHVSVAKSSGSNLLDEAALAAVKKWKFIPAQNGAEKIAASVTVPIIFKITEG